MINIKIKYIIGVIILILILTITKISNAFTITIDAGHGGNDPGAINKEQSIYEKDVNLKIAMYLKEYLSQYKDTNIIMTREEDVFLEVYDRAIIGRNNKSDLFISIHMNSSESTDIQGAEVYVTHNTCLDKYNKEMTILGNRVLTNLNNLGIINRGVKTRVITADDTDIYSDGTIADYYGVIRYSMRGTKIDSGVLKPEGAISANIQDGEGVPAILIEHCYINSNDYEFANTDEEIKKLAKADADAIIQHYNLEKKNYVNFKIKDNDLIINPNTTFNEIKTEYETAQIISENKEIIATGTKIQIEDVVYNTIKLGDCNGDGNITPADYVKVKNHIMQSSTLTDIDKIAADVNEDLNITPADYIKIKNHIMEVSKIEIKVEEELNEK